MAASEERASGKVDPIHDEVVERPFPSEVRANLRAVHAAELLRRNANEKLANPLGGYPHEDLRLQGAQYARRLKLEQPEDVRAFEIGAVLAQDPSAYDQVEGLTPDEMDILRREVESRWSQPKMLYLVIVLCSVCAALQGMDETVVNGAQLFYIPQFGIENDTWTTGLVNSAPYLCCAFLGCWISIPLNKRFGRRGTIFMACAWSAIVCIWQALTNTWWHMFIARLALGLGIGPISATVPVFASECSPPLIRGALVMQWQVFTAFGIMLGFAASMVFYPVTDVAHITGLNWRLMMGSPALPAIIACSSVFLCPESPRWYMSRGEHHNAYKAVCRLRHSKLQAARDVFLQAVSQRAEKAIYEVQREGHKFQALDLVRIPRNRRSMLASEIVMFMQQFCGVNVIAYYSSIIFREGGFSDINALAASLGFGAINFLFAIPAIFTIDRFGRRNLLLSTLPLLAACLFLTGFSFYIPESSKAHIALIALGIYLFGVVYSPGAGPVPFTYSAEAYPLSVRSIGMSLATATTWFFNFLLAITWPSLLKAFRPQGAFAFYGVWNLVFEGLVYLFVPETKGRSLEELDQVFGVPTSARATYGVQRIWYFVQSYVLRRNDVKEVTLCNEKDDSDDNSSA